MNINIARFAIVPALALSITVGGFAVDASANANAKGDKAKGDTAAAGCVYGVSEEPAVVITGGTVSNETNLDLSANAGTAVGDASGGSFNVSTGEDISVAGQGGGANASANGGAIAVGDINSGGNAGNAIIVGDTVNCAPEPEKPVEPAKPEKPVEPVKPEKPVKEQPVYEAPVETPVEAPVEAPAAAPVVALPATGVGLVDAGLLSALAAAGAAGAAGIGLRRRG